jgi:hypothetical protein
MFHVLLVVQKLPHFIEMNGSEKFVCHKIKINEEVLPLTI